MLMLLHAITIAAIAITPCRWLPLRCHAEGLLFAFHCRRAAGYAFTLPPDAMLMSPLLLIFDYLR